MTGPTLRSLLAPAAAGAVLALAACGGGGGPQAAAATPSPAPSAAPSSAASPVATTSVAIVNFAFRPAVITVRAGTTVTWTNQDEDAHTVAIGGQPVSQPLQNADVFTHTFGQPGTYAYACSIHPYMRGMVVVTGA